MSGGSHVLHVHPTDAESIELLAPSVGVFTPAVAQDEIVSPGQVVGTIDVLGVLRDLVVPEGVVGRVARCMGDGRSRVPVQYGDPLLAISTASTGDIAATTSSADVQSALSFVAPMSGRFHSRPSPTEPPFVKVGDTVQHGQTIGLLEVMKTFNRLVYEGETLPERAGVEQIMPKEGDDVVRGDVILALASSS